MKGVGVLSVLFVCIIVKRSAFCGDFVGLRSTFFDEAVVEVACELGFAGCNLYLSFRDSNVAFLVKVLTF